LIPPIYTESDTHADKREAKALIPPIYTESDTHESG